ncbi:MAG: DUF4105 domain-containing protein [Bacteroidales bacterium]|nr:DUF4105 domain-containing protein [Bacteroidales bacterium]
MKRLYSISLILIIALSAASGAEPSVKEPVSAELQSPSLPEVYLVTCGTGEETYSMYGHSALRIVDRMAGSDLVYNWGVFDFSTPNFAVKFARGRLDYLLASYSYQSFLQEYFREERSVVTQRINLNAEQTERLQLLLAENMKPENINYRYDFFMDNCATRIRDILENALADDLIYPESVSYTGTENDKELKAVSDNDIPSFRDRINEYQQGSLVWLDAGIDLLLGSPADENCGFRESMFLPDYLMINMSQAYVNSEEGTVSLLEEAVPAFEFDPPTMENSFYTMPWFLLGVVVIILIILTWRIKEGAFQKIFDVLFFIIMAVLSFLMIFTNYLTDHAAMGSNYNIIWLNPLLLAAPVIMFLRPPNRWFWKSQIALTLTFMVVIVIVNQSINPAWIPVMVLLIARSHYRLTTF